MEFCIAVPKKFPDKELLKTEELEVFCNNSPSKLPSTSFEKIELNKELIDPTPKKVWLNLLA